MSDKPSKQSQVSLTTEGNQDFLQLSPQGGGPVSWIDKDGSARGALAVAGIPAGTNTAIQFNDNDVFGGQATNGTTIGVSWDKVEGEFTVMGAPGGFQEILGGATGSAGFQIDDTTSPPDVIVDNLETGGTISIAADGTISVLSESATTQIQDTAGNPMIEVGGTAQLGFYGAAITAKPTVTGAKGGNAALTSLIAQLVTLGLITDGTS